MDPLGSLSAAGVGWAIEHVSFLREPLDAMLGDPPVIEARAQAWHLFSRELGAQADEFEATVARETAGWVGEAADAYRVAAGRLRDALASTAADADRVAGTVLDSAAMVGTVRSLVRDMIADWVGRLVAVGCWPPWSAPGGAGRARPLGAAGGHGPARRGRD